MTFLRQLWVQVLLATLAGILLGHFAPAAGAAAKPLGDLFIALIRMMIGPVVFCTVVQGIAGLSDLRRVGRVAMKAFVYFEAVTTAALVLALAAAHLWRPGEGMNIDVASLDAAAVKSYVTSAHDQSVSGFLLDVIPDSLLGALTGGKVLQVLLVATLTGVAIASVGERARPLLRLVDATAAALFRIVALIMYLAPIGAFGAIAFAVGRFGSGSLAALGSLIAEFFVVCLLFTGGILGGIAALCGVSLLRLIAYIRDELLIVAATTSSETVLPRLIQKLERLGCDEAVVGFVVPAGYSFNLDGTCLYLTTVALFLAQATGTPLSLAQQLGLIAVLLLTSKGAAGVAGAAFVVLAATLGAVGTIPVASIALVLGIHRILAEGLTFVNVVGNCVATIVIARWEGAVDLDRLAREVGSRGLRRREPVRPMPVDRPSGAGAE